MSLVKVVSLACVAWAAGCASTAPAPKGAANPDIAGEVSRICALPSGEREQALEKLKRESGMVLFCGSKE